MLVRLKVDRLGFATLSNQRFGARFVGECANPADILLFHQRRRAADDGKPTAAARPRPRNEALDQPVLPDTDELNVEDLVADQLKSSDRKVWHLAPWPLRRLRTLLGAHHLLAACNQLKLLKETDLQIALDEYVNKKAASSIGELVEATLVIPHATVFVSSENVTAEVAVARGQELTQKKLSDPEFSLASTVALIQEAVEQTCAGTQSQATPRPPRAPAAAAAAAADSEDDEPTPRAAPRAKRSPVKRTRNARDDDDDEEEV